MDRGVGALEFAPFDVELVITEAKDHSWAKDLWDGPRAPAACNKTNIPASPERRLETNSASRTSKEHLEVKS
jgi:hypothetical protein